MSTQIYKNYITMGVTLSMRYSLSAV